MNDSNSPILQFDDVSVEISGNLILHDINLRVHKGEYVGIIGRNGSGKTTLLKTAIGLYMPSKGQVRYHGRKINSNIREMIGYVPQMHTITREFPATVGEVVGMGLFGANFFGINTRLSSQQKKDKIMLALHKVNMEDYINRPIGHLSGGEQQKVLLAHALVREPEILLLDEPTSALDFTMVAQFLRLLTDINKKFNITLLVIQHNLEMLRPYCSRLVILRRCILYDGDPKISIADDMIKKAFSR